MFEEYNASRYASGGESDSEEPQVQRNYKQSSGMRIGGGGANRKRIPLYTAAFASQRLPHFARPRSSNLYQGGASNTE
jgi:hypothetical protein